jgi:alpha-L-glutamate ligase-like protein
VIFSAFHRLADNGVLGINRRNAEYIMPSNPRSAYPLVDDKVLTKRLAEKYQVPIPPLYQVIEHHGDIARFRQKLVSLRQFVVKPARGSGGSGILLFVDHVPEGFTRQNGEIISQEGLSYHISSIISGIYSLEGLEDRALIESLIIPDPVFAAVTYQGVPDIRIVVYRGVPVMAMVRLPTRASDGKANLHGGAIGAGIEIPRGITMTAVHRSLTVTHHPDTGHPVSGIQVPHWEKLLSIAARASDMTGLGYLGVDLVIDRERGPLLLELNARPGLAIQLANRIGLRGRLEQIDRAPTEIFSTPETRVAWAKETFIPVTPHSELDTLRQAGHEGPQ